MSRLIEPNKARQIVEEFITNLPSPEMKLYAQWYIDYVYKNGTYKVDVSKIADVNKIVSDDKGYIRDFIDVVMRCARLEYWGI